MTRGYDQKAKLLWSTPSELIVPSNPDPYDPKLPAPPALTGRYYLSTPAGHLELLYALPNDATIESPVDGSWKDPVLFLHGGFGSANCYSNFLPWFAARGYPVYSVALRGHGRSWQPSFWGLYFTSKETLADDVAAALRFIRKRHPGAGPTTLVGHSSGGGLSQHVVDSGKGEGVGKLVVLAGIPSFGGWRVYWNWFKLDPWFPVRVLWDLYHPRSPLSSTRLVHRAFFAPDYPIDKVRRFEGEMSYSESMLWPSGMMFPFVNRSRLLSNLVASSSNQRAVLLTIGGAQDTLVSVPIMRRLANLYAATNVGIGVRSVKLGVRNISALQHEFTSGVAKEREEEKEEGRVWFAEISGPGAGHNLMRDDKWQDCARVIEAFLEG